MYTVLLTSIPIDDMYVDPLIAYVIETPRTQGKNQ